MLLGCAINSGVTAMGPDTYLVTRQAASGFSGTGSLKAKAIQESQQFCDSQGLEMKILAVTESQPQYVLGNFPKAEVVFKALPEGHPELNEVAHYDAYNAQIKVGDRAEKRISKTTENSDKYDKLLKLSKLKDTGVITDEEFKTEKQKILN